MDLSKLPSILFASAQASVHFTLACLEPHKDHLRAKSSFVNPRGESMHWHDFGDLEGPGWAGNAIGGAALLYRWGQYRKDAELQGKALALVDHILEDGFIDKKSGFIWPYYDLATKSFCLNYTHNNDWLCPGSLAKIGVQMLELAGLVQPDARAAALTQAALHLAEWVDHHTPRLPNGWLPRRITVAGRAYPHSPTGGPDPIFSHSADGLFLLELYTALSALGLADYRNQAAELGDAFVSSGGFWGSINHDTYDDHESVAYSVAYRVLNRASDALNRPEWKAFASEVALPALDRFRMNEDRQGVQTRGLLFMEDSWDTAYLWENAEAAQAYLESWYASGRAEHLELGLGILRAIANHHHGALGFLTEGVDWNNHVTRRHHIGEALFGDINYTEPLLNHLHFLGPTLLYLEKTGFEPPKDIDAEVAINIVRALNKESQAPIPGVDGAGYYLRFYYPALETDERLEQALDFTRRSGADGVLLFEASYDMDPALLTIEVLRERFARLKAIVPRFREVVPEVHINMMITLGHVDAGCARPERFPFQFIVDEQGNRSRSTVCPLDPAFLEQAAEVYGLAAKCTVDVVWVDDDTRLLMHDLTGIACFCPLHMQAFQSHTWQSWTRKDLVDALCNEAENFTGHALRDAWFDVQEESLLGLARTIEQAVHQVNPSTRIGLMTVGSTYHAAEGRRTDRLLRTLAGGTRPLIRPGSGFWNDWQPGQVLEKTEDCARQISFLGPDVQALAEIENHPYSPYLKSNRVLALELALDILAGMPDLSLNLLTSMGGKGPLEPEGTDYATLLSSQRPFLNALAREWSGRVRRGIGVAFKEDTPRMARLHGKGLRAWIEPRPWEPTLARLGFPIGRPDQGPHWIAGEVGQALSAGEWNQYLKEGAILDPFATQTLLDRGLGKRFGLVNMHPVNVAVNELFTEDARNGARRGHILPAYNHIPIDQLYAWDLSPNAGCVLSRWQDVDGQDRGSALVLLEAEGGWRIALLPFALRAPAPVLLNIAHREQWAGVLEWCAGAALPVRVVQGSSLTVQAFYRPDDASWLVAAANLTADDALDARLKLNFVPRAVEALDKYGVWKPIPAGENSILEIEAPAFSLSAWRIS